jgi:uncharacterized RDD family membrane protein YckC
MRFLAFLVDFLILSLVLDIAHFSFELGSGYEPFAASSGSSLWFGLLMVLYFTFQEGRGVSSWGKRVLGLTVVGTDGEGISWSRSALRSLIAVITCGAGFLWALANRDRRAFHDVVTGTRVVKT